MDIRKQIEELNKQYEELAIKRDKYESEHPKALSKHWSTEEYKTLSAMNNELQFINAQAQDLREESNIFLYPNVSSEE